MPISISDKKRKILLVLSALVIPFIIYFYFWKWRTNAAYGDDLYIFKVYSGLNNFSDKVNLPVSFGKYRPVQGFSMFMLIEWFQKNVYAYYLFNIGIQTVNTFLFAMLLNLFLRSPFFSLFFALIIGVCRFSYFNISQLLNGGALEGLAMTFFLACLYFLIRPAIKNEMTVEQKQKWLIWSVVFANLSMYTHERYILLIPFVAIATFLLPPFRIIPARQKIGLALIMVISIILNIALKKNVYSLPFFMGTGGTNIQFSFSTAVSYFWDGILSIFQINSGPQYLAGAVFTDLRFWQKVWAIILSVSVLLILVAYLFKVRSFFINKRKDKQTEFYIFFLLLALAILALIPAVITIRLEPRWLQASLAMFVLVTAIAFNNLFKDGWLKKLLFFLFIALFLIVDYTYFVKGVRYLALNSGVQYSSLFKTAMTNGVIQDSTRNLYIWETTRDPNTEAAVKWILGDGYIFDFYQDKPKNLLFADPEYRKNDTVFASTFGNFDRQADQVVYVDQKNKIVVDLTSDFLRDSLKSFSQERLDLLANFSRIYYDPKHITVTIDSFDRYVMTGFHEKEGAIRWTNGNASIEFLRDYPIHDSVTIELNTYMPPNCKDIKPKVSLVDRAGNEYQPVDSSRVGDKFIYRFFQPKQIMLRRIRLLAATIYALPDVRILSFPFISLELKQ
jgi:hypothetical protein